MRKLISGILLCLSLSAFADAVEAFNNQHVQNVYNRLLRATGVKPLPIYVLSGVLNRCSLSCTNGQRIVVTTELLSLVKNEDELAGVIGHEMAHAIYTSELEADILGLKYAQKAGYSYCRAAQFMKGFAEDSKHPSGSVRYKNSGCP